MAKKSLADASADLYKLLEPFEPAERLRIVKSTLVLLGDTSSASELSAPATASQQHATGQQASTQGRGQQTPSQVPFDQARKFFNDKVPKGTSEAFATAALFFESHGGGRVMLKDDFRAVMEGARRDFTAANYARDMDNATKSGFFNAGGNAKKGYTLSGYGQDFIEALPDRTTANAVQRPGRSGWAKAKRKKPSPKSA